MMRSLFSGVSGLKNHQTRMDVIGNNISNVNTTGFKYSRTTFADTLSQTLTGAAAPTDNLGGVNAKQIGLGSSVASIDMIFTDGSVQSTGKNTDLCLSGNGLFVVKKGDQTYYTRNGAFEFDASGNYVLPGSGLYVQGWMGGTITTTSTDASGNKVTTSEWGINTNADTTNIVVQAGKSMPAAQTTKSDYLGNLDASTTAQVTTTITAYDSQGFKYSIPIIFEKVTSQTNPNLGTYWKVMPSTVATQNARDTKNTTTATAYTTFTPFTIHFTTTGALDTSASMIQTQPISVTLFTNHITGASSPINTTITLSFTGLTCYDSESTLYATSDGNAAGTLESISIDSSGVITGVYTNGGRRAEAQVAVAQFSNASGLTKTGNSLYQESNNSGTANVKTATALGVTITPSALEMSNVDVANEFADMIITQRGFQSNSKIVTVGDEMLETVINMKR